MSYPNNHQYRSSWDYPEGYEASRSTRPSHLQYEADYYNRENREHFPSGNSYAESRYGEYSSSRGYEREYYDEYTRHGDYTSHPPASYAPPASYPSYPYPSTSYAQRTSSARYYDYSSSASYYPADSSYWPSSAYRPPAAAPDSPPVKSYTPLRNPTSSPPSALWNPASPVKSRQYSFVSRKIVKVVNKQTKPPTPTSTPTPSASTERGGMDTAAAPSALPVAEEKEEKAVIRDQAVVKRVELSLALLEHKIALAMVQMGVVPLIEEKKEEKEVEKTEEKKAEKKEEKKEERKEERREEKPLPPPAPVLTVPSASLPPPPTFTIPPAKGERSTVSSQAEPLPSPPLKRSTSSTFSRREEALPLVPLKRSLSEMPAQNKRAQLGEKLSRPLSTDREGRGESKAPPSKGRYEEGRGYAAAHPPPGYSSSDYPPRYSSNNNSSGASSGYAYNEYSEGRYYPPADAPPSSSSYYPEGYYDQREGGRPHGEYYERGREYSDYDYDYYASARDYDGGYYPAEQRDGREYYSRGGGAGGGGGGGGARRDLPPSAHRKR